MLTVQAKQFVDNIFGHTHPVVLHGHHNRLTGTRQVQVYSAPFFGELDGIRKQIPYNCIDGLFVQADIAGRQT